MMTECNESATLDSRQFEPRQLAARDVALFQEIIYRHFQRHGRRFPWRETTNPYHVLISEVMLQQTQTSRVTAKFEQFVTAFPDFAALHQASLQEVLSVWQGLGYNRRAVALKRTAELVTVHFHGRLPTTPEALRQLPGIGVATAASIAVFAFGQPVVFIETNIRAVFIYFFFRSNEAVADRELMPLAAETLDRQQPRLWYNALMDYGVLLKKQAANPARASLHYHRQSSFKGSNREVRGALLRYLLQHPQCRETELAEALATSPERLDRNLAALAREGFIMRDADVIRVQK